MSHYGLFMAKVLVLIGTLILQAAPGPTWKASVQQQVPAPARESRDISTPEFARIVREFSEDGGYFRSDNFISNETSYLHVADKLQQLGATGGAYIGVGPEQNFTYIAKTRPQIVFIIDIRRQAIIQHLMFKAIFHMASNRNQFLYLLLSRPQTGKDVPGVAAPIEDVMSYLGKTPADPRIFNANLAEIKKVIQEGFQFPLSAQDASSLGYVYESFRVDGLDISFRLDGGGSGLQGFFPTFGELILERDLNGKRGNFLTNTEDYDFVRRMQESNLIIPIVGDFAGKKALASIADYLKKRNYTLSCFYTSNVEQYLFESGSFNGFAENVRKLPITDKSLFIRSVFDFVGPHPSRVPGHNVTTLLQNVPIFLKDFDGGHYTDYWELVTTHFIAGERPKG